MTHIRSRSLAAAFAALLLAAIPTGSLYHNRHVNTVTAFGTGQARCSFNIIWRNSFPGWRQRFICTS